MNKTVLSFINKCEKWKVEIKENHWSAKSLSQHELCDDIASSISDFEDLVSEVEQSISGKFKNGDLKPEKAEKIELKPFVEGVISSSQEFLKELEKMGDKYIGIKSECETFIGDMQRKLYLVNFTLKEELKARIKNAVNESMPKNIMKHDEIDKFMGRRPKTMKARINQIYKIVKKYGIDSKVYNDDVWQAISDYHKAISSLGCEVNMKPCADLANRESISSDGGYTDYDKNDHMARSKQYAVDITFEDGMKISGYIKCMAAGTMEDPFSLYDTCIVLWPKNNRVLEDKEMKGQIKLTEAELKQVVKEAAIKLLSETRLDYDIDNFSGRWDKNEPSDEEYALASSSANGDYLDDPFNPPNNWDDDEWVDGDKDLENDYSWDKFDHKPIAQGLDDYYKVGKRAIPREVDDAITRRNKTKDWDDKEIRHGKRVMGKYINGKYDGNDVGDAWDDLHYESKKPMKVTESELKQLVKEAAMTLIRECIKEKQDSIKIKPSKKGTFTAAATKHGKSVQGFANQVLKNKDNYSPTMVKKANFAKNFGGKK